MAKKTSFVSPGVYQLETDLSQLPRAAAQIGGAFIGVTKKGPAFVKTDITSFSGFRTRYGGLDPTMYVPYAVQAYLQNAPVASIVRVLGRGNPNNGYIVDLGRGFVLAWGNTDLNNGLTSSSFVSSMTGIETMCILRSRQSAGADIINTVSYTGNPSNFSITVGSTTVSNLSLDRTQKNYIKNILGTNPKFAYNGDSVSGVYVDSLLDYRFGSLTSSYTGSALGSTNNPASGSASSLRYITGGYKTAATPMFVSQPYVSGTAATIYNLFQLVSLTDGENSNQDIKVSIQDVELTTISPKVAPKFTVVIRDYNDTDARPVVLESFRCDLDSNSDYYISRVIGDRYPVVTITNPGDVPVTVWTNDFPNKSAFVRVNIQTGYKFDCRPAGFLGPKTIDPATVNDVNGNVILENDIPLNVNHLSPDGYKSNKVFLGFKFDGTAAIGFPDRLHGSFSSVDGTNASKGFLILATTGESSLSYNNPSVSAANSSLTSTYTVVDVAVTGDANIINGGYYFTAPLLGGHDGISPSVQYDIAINDGTLSSEFISALGVVANPDEVDINLLCIPGVHTGAATYNGQLIARAIEMCEDRADCFFIADIGQVLSPTDVNITTSPKNAAILDATQAVLGYDSNYAAAYYPWCRIYDADANRMVWVPPSVEVVGVYAYTDRVAHPWYAPAGFNRGNLNTVIEAARRLTENQRDTLYLGRVNPIATFVNQGIVVYGQKTLQKDASALDRVNVRRLLLSIKKTVAGIGRLALFEPNNAKARARLLDALTPIFQRIQNQNGLNRFQIIIDESNNGPDVIDRNEMNGTILIEPTKATEILKFQYVITRTGAKFTEIVENLGK